MAELVPAPFRDLLARLFLEPERQGTLFELPRRSWYAPAADTPDFSVPFHGGRAGNPVGPASGPHTQMAQNLLLCYVAGSRILEFKTVQVNDRLHIPRPCIDMANVGYNVEWSQELLVEESLREYVAGMMLIEIFRHAHPLADPALRGPAGEVIYDISLGYDLAGIRSDKVQAFLDGLRDASAVIESLRAEIPDSFAAARNLDFPTTISTTLTLSTFHGCPTDEIERICEFLLGERGLDVIVKMNPPTLGKDELEHLLRDVMGYTEITVRPDAYSASQTFDEAVDMVRRLQSFAAARGRRFGCKFSNTLEVLNHRPFFTADNEVMYLSGRPLHVITMALTARFREIMGPRLPLSFSAGIEAKNFPGAVACGFVPVTTCTDLLKMGGYARLPEYLKNLETEMAAVGAKTIGEWMLKAFGHGEEARRRAGEEAALDEVVAWAGLLNTRTAADNAAADPMYGAEKNRLEPKRINSRLVTFDCITCDKCIPVCPNAAIFSYPLPMGEFEFHDLEVLSTGEVRAAAETRKFTITKKHQIAEYGEFCNECGNCDTFCPETGGPYIEKPVIYRTAESYEAAAPRKGFHVEPLRVRGRLNGIDYVVEFDEQGRPVRFADSTAEVEFDGGVPSRGRLLTDCASATINMESFYTLKAIREGVLDAARLNQVNASLAAV